MAAASGLALLPTQDRDPTLTTSYGTGELIRAALDLGARHIVVGIGGSATNDGGIGMASALGVRFLDARGRAVPPIGSALGQTCRIDATGLDPRLAGLRCEAICDVDNPLLGPHGAARVYGPQKGASQAQVEGLEAGFVPLASVIARDLGVEVRDLPGAGAAGGLGAGRHAFLGASGSAAWTGAGPGSTRSRRGRPGDHGGGSDRPPDRLRQGTGRGGAAGQGAGCPCLVIAGSIDGATADLHRIGIDAVFSLCPGPLSLQQAMEATPTLLCSATEQAVRCFLSGRRSG